MSDDTLQPCGTEQGLLFGVLALQLEFIRRGDLQQALKACADDKRQSLPSLLAARGAISPARASLLQSLVREILAQHGSDPSLSLASVCAARSEPLDLYSMGVPALCGALATLPTLPHTLPGPPLPDAPPASRDEARRFRVIRTHARGALGEVFVAQDEELNREVALKEMQSPYAADAGCRARFVAEAEITGQLEHPGIVPVYGMGTHPDGRPYYAMRFIRGESLQDAIASFHAERNGLGSLKMRRLLARFVNVCESIAYAHSRGVIHRDIKPANIMLGPYGETLVVDWGLAKASGRILADDSCAMPVAPVAAREGAGTILGRAVGTPCYMPPEQAAGKLDQVGPAADIYALGATLYQLLTGRLPIDGANVLEILHKAEHGEIVPPRKARSDVPAALESVVLTAMAFKPRDRYASAHELAQEVEHWLADEPVKAHREANWEKASRWMRRNRPVVAGAAALLVTALVGLAVGLYAVGREQVRTARQRDAANQNLERAEANLRRAREAVDECFVLASREPILQQEKMKPVRELLLSKALPFYEGFQSQKPDDESLNAEMGENLFRVALIMSELGKKEAAIQRYEQARRIFAALAEESGRASYRADLARVWHNLGKIRHELDAFTKARAAYGEALELRALLAKGGDADARLELAETHNNLGALDQQEGRLDAARSHLEHARRLAAPLAATSADAQRALGATAHNLGRMLDTANDPAAALAAYEEARQARRKLADDGRLSRALSDLASTLAHIAELHSRGERPEEAMKAYGEAGELLRSALSMDQPDELADLASVEDQAGSLLREQKKLPEAMARYAKALDAQERLARTHPGTARYRRDLAGTRVNVGHLKRDAGDPKEALEWYGKAFAALGDDAGARPVRVRAHWGRAEALGKLGRHSEAARDWDAARGLGPAADRRFFHVQGAYARARAGDHAAALKDADELEAAGTPAKDLLYELACVSALAHHAAKGAPAAAEKCALRALGYLRRAKAAGFFDKDKAEHARKDEDLASLKGREDFDTFLAGLPRP